MADPRTFLFMPESAYGPTNNCIGVGAELLRRGHRVVFAAEASWKGKLAALGFEEDLVDLAPPAADEAEQDAGSFWKEYIREISPQFRKTTSEQLETVTAPIWEELFSGAQYCEPQLRNIIARVQPDVIVEDNVIAFPALVTAGVPFVRIMSCQPLEKPADSIPPVFSGLPADAPDTWPDFLEEYDRTHRPLWERVNAWVQEQGAPPLPDMEFMHDGDVSLYVYPEEADYEARSLDDSWHRIDSSVRGTDTEVSLPDGFADGSRPVVYFSLGSLGSADVSLMRRVIEALAPLPIDVIVSKGPLHDELELAENMWGEEFLPQTRLIPRADLVITHGGNNTTTEALHFGKPMILLPLFWDQYDNAQRMHELGFGTRLDPYRFTPDEMRETVTAMLDDTSLRGRVAAIGEAIRGREGVLRAADLIESAVARAGAGE